ncbi:hypothetical protein A9Q84_15955 [Halobacteriovorax marinus]|uniref:Response regulatory domain-containing protein n=1 Tax=Halobacteriovorax marinus TaxID=97084 RepID=A0A1Y5F9V1_9BACT|nr:hypothetical protein A9Q84_15955 [Halobacteriovorax marinus]
MDNSNQNLVSEFKIDALELIEKAEESIQLIMSNESTLNKQYNTIFNSFHSLKGSLGMFGFLSESHLIHKIEDIFTAYESKSEFDEFDLNAILSSLAVVAYRMEGKDHSLSPHLFDDIKHLLGDHSCEISKTLIQKKSITTSSSDQLNVLFVDDDIDYQTIARVKLSDVCKLDFCSSAQEGLNKLRDNIGLYHAIFCDYKMPDDNGLYLVDVLNTIKLNIPIVLFSANADREDLKKILQRGVFSYVDKKDGASAFKLVINRLQRGK